MPLTFDLLTMHAADPLLRLLIVEDDVVTRAGLQESIERSTDLQVVAAVASGREALAVLETKTVDVALVDVGLPDISGIELIPLIHQKQAACDCLVISIFGDEDTVLKALCAGACGYLLKDSHMLSLSEAVLSVRAGGSPISPLIARKVLHRLRFTQGLQTSALDLGSTSSSSDGRELHMTPREQELLQLMTRGFTYSEAAELMGVSLHAVQALIKSIYRKLTVRSKTEAIYEARALGFLR